MKKEGKGENPQEREPVHKKVPLMRAENLLPVEGREKPSPLAQAIVQRLQKEELWASNITKRPYQPIPIDSGVHAGLVDQYITRPQSLPSTREYVTNLYEMSDPEACKARVQELLPGQNFGNLTDENAKKILMLPQLAASDINPKPPIARIIEQLETVQSLAHEKRVSPEEIFLEDELYKEFVRRTTSVDEVAAKIVESMNNIDPKKIKQDMRNSHIATMHILGKEQLRDKEIDEADSPRETAETEQFVAKVRETIMSQGVAKIKRFWGKQEIKQLDPELQQELGFDKETERVATAMDKRNKRELQWMKNVVSRNTGSQLTDVTDGNSPLLIRETYTAILECFEKDEPEETFAQAVSDTVQEKLLEYEVDDAFRTDGDLEDKTKIVTFSASEIGSSLIGEKLQLLSKLSLGRVDSLTRSLPKADELAQQFFVPVEEVYENEKLYTELIRSTYASPEEYAQTRLAQLPELTYENFQRLEIVEGLLCYTNLDGREELERQELEESSTPKATARLDQRVAQAKRSLAFSTRAELSRFWGKDDLFDLSPQTQYDLVRYEPGQKTVVVYKDYQPPRQQEH